jgi:hypothetical protein
MSAVEDSSEEEILIESNKQILFHLERYLWQRRERIENRAKSYQDLYIDLLCDFVISQESELSELDVGTKHIIADNKKIRDEIRVLNRSLLMLDKKIAPIEKENTPRAEQFTRARVQALAKYLWSMNPEMTITEIAEHEAIFNLKITGAKGYTLDTIKKWVAAVDPRAPEKKRGRPRKAKK